MAKHICLLIILMASHSFANSQRVNFQDIKSILNNTTNGAELLLNKGFELENSQDFFKDFILKALPNEDISIRIDEPSDFGAKRVQVSYSKVYHTDFAKLLEVIKSKGKKQNFFYSSYYRLYFTEYSFSGMHIYVCKGIVSNTLTGYKYNSFLFSYQPLNL